MVTAWVSMGGSIWWGRGNETSCFLVARKDDHRLGNIWPVVLYPSGKCEVVFQHMSVRPPFDDVQLREEFRQKLNKIPGVDLPSSKLELRPGFPLSVLADEEARNLFLAPPPDTVWQSHELAPVGPVLVGHLPVRGDHAPRPPVKQAT